MTARCVSASHLPQAAQLATLYAGKCGEVHYKLAVSQENHTVAFSADDPGRAAQAGAAPPVSWYSLVVVFQLRVVARSFRMRSK